MWFCWLKLYLMQKLVKVHVYNIRAIAKYCTQVELDQALISESLQTLLHVAGYMIGNLRFGKLLLTMVSRHQASMLEHLEDIEQLAAMINPPFMQRSLQLAIKKLQ